MFRKNVFYSILFNPKKTISHVIEKDPNKHLWVLSSIPGFIFIFSIMQSASMGLYMPLGLIFLLSVLLSPFVGFVLITLGTWIIRGTGLWIGTRGKFINIRASYAYSQVPLIGYIATELILLLTFGKRLFIHFPEGQDLLLHEIFVLYAASVFQIVFIIWSVLVLIKTLAEVKHTSVLKAIVNLILAIVVYVVLAFLVSLPFVSRCSNFFDYPELTNNLQYQEWQKTFL